MMYYFLICFYLFFAVSIGAMEPEGEPVNPAHSSYRYFIDQGMVCVRTTAAVFQYCMQPLIHGCSALCCRLKYYVSKFFLLCEHVKLFSMRPSSDSSLSDEDSDQSYVLESDNTLNDVFEPNFHHASHKEEDIDDAEFSDQSEGEITFHEVSYEYKLCDELDSEIEEYEHGVSHGEEFDRGHVIRDLSNINHYKKLLNFFKCNLVLARTSVWKKQKWIKRTGYVWNVNEATFELFKADERFLGQVNYLLRYLETNCEIDAQKIKNKIVQFDWNGQCNRLFKERRTYTVTTGPNAHGPQMILQGVLSPLDHALQLVRVSKEEEDQKINLIGNIRNFFIIVSYASVVPNVNEYLMQYRWIDNPMDTSNQLLFDQLTAFKNK